MTLQAAVQARLSTQKLVQLTNQDNLSATAINTTVLDAAVADAQAEFTDETNLTFDITDNRHLRVGVLGVQAYLESYVNSQSQAYQELRREFERGLAKIAVSLGAERRLLPSSNNTTSPSVPRSGLKPEQDRTRWDDFVPRQPGGSDEFDDGII